MPEVTSRTAEKEQAAFACVNTPTKLRARLRSARALLPPDVAAAFTPGKEDLPNRRLLSNDGRYALVWRVRRWPDQPESYENQQTTSGGVSVQEVPQGDCASAPQR